MTDASRRLKEAPSPSVEREVEIAAPVDAVWKALTEAEELTRWFPLDAGVEPGRGGTIWMKWEADGERDNNRIEIWEPGRHLRTVGSSGPWVGVATDYYLQARGGGTVLRVVSSGFSGEDWNEVLGSFGLGWDFELRGLRHYLERHRGTRRIVARAQAGFRSSAQEAWARLTGPGGWFGAEGLDDREPGAGFRVGSQASDELIGTVELMQPPSQFAATLSNWNDARFRLPLYHGEAMLWVATYGVEPSRVQALEQRWQNSLQEVLLAPR